MNRDKIIQWEQTQKCIGPFFHDDCYQYVYYDIKRFFGEDTILTLEDVEDLLKRS